MEIVPTALLLALVKKFTDAVKAARDGNRSALVTQSIAWLAGVLGTLLLAASDFGASVSLGGDLVLADVNVAAQVFIGLTVASAGSLAHDTLGVIETRRSE